MSCDTRLTSIVGAAAVRMAECLGYGPEDSRAIGAAISGVTERAAVAAPSDAAIDVLFRAEAGTLELAVTSREPAADAPAAAGPAPGADTVECRVEDGLRTCRIRRALPETPGTTCG